MATMVRWISDSTFVDPAADLADEVRVGQYCVIGPHVRIERGSDIGQRVWLGSATRLAEGTRVGDFCVIGERTIRQFRFGSLPSIHLGRGVTLDRGVVIEGDCRHGSTRLGTECRIDSLVKISAGARLGDSVHLGSGCSIESEARIESGSHLGSGCRVAPRVKVGRNCVIGALSEVTHDVPPHVLAEGIGPVLRGVNVSGLLRLGVDPRGIQSMSEAFRRIVRNGMPCEEVMKKLQEQGQWTTEVREFVAYFADSAFERTVSLRQPGRVA